MMMMSLSRRFLVCLVLLCLSGAQHFGAVSFSASSVGSNAASVKPPPGARYNFGPATTIRDGCVLYTAERPGNDPNASKSDKVSDDKVREWISFIKEQGVSRVVALLDENELEPYEPTGLMSLYKAGGLDCSVQPMREPGAAYNLFKILLEAEKSNTKVVTHCTGGIGRCGRVCAGWLVFRYGLSPTEATEEVLASAKEYHVTRAGDAGALSKWIEAGVQGSDTVALYEKLKNDLRP